MPDVSLEAEPDLVHSLDEWLRDVDALRGRTRLVQARPRPGTLGEEPVLLVGIDSEPQVAALTRTVELWLRVRGRGVTLKIRIGRRVTELDMRGDVDIDHLIRQMNGLLRDAIMAAGE